MKAITKLERLFLKIFYSFWYGVNFESGYEYKRIESQNLHFLEIYHQQLINMGWEKYTDVESGIFSAYCWYRKKLN